MLPVRDARLGPPSTRTRTPGLERAERGDEKPFMATPTLPSGASLLSRVRSSSTSRRAVTGPNCESRNHPHQSPLQFVPNASYRPRASQGGGGETQPRGVEVHRAGERRHADVVVRPGEARVLPPRARDDRHEAPKAVGGVHAVREQGAHAGGRPEGDVRGGVERRREVSDRARGGREEVGVMTSRGRDSRDSN
eukprot:31032-Pelagococcus_subviridis.AAC.35